MLKDALADLQNIDKESKRLSNSIKAFKDKIELYCSNDSTLGVDSKD